MPLDEQVTILRVTDAFRNGDFFHNRRRGNSHDLACRDHVYLCSYCYAQDNWCYIPGTDYMEFESRDWDLWGPEEEDGYLLRYMNAFARKIQRCWFNREEQPMACPCPEAPF